MKIQVKMREKYALSEFDPGIVVGASSSILETADLMGVFTHNSL